MVKQEKVAKICFICSGTEWTDVDYLREKPQNMVVCNSCGFVTFNRFNEKTEYENYYDQEYRKGNVVTVSNLITTNRKIGYHEIFLKDFLTSKKDMAVCDIGSGIGYFLNYCKNKYGHKDISGVELTGSFRRYCKNNFNIDTSPEFDTTKKYDLVACYHTLEHIPDPADLLNKIKSTLNPGGKLYVATPIWMEELMKFGGGVFGTEAHPFDEHFHQDHINAWSRWHLQELFAIIGWKIVKEDRQMYGSTYLLEPTESRAYQPPKRGSDIYPWERISDDVITQLTDMKRACTYLMKGNMGEAMRIYPRTVDAILGEIGNSFKDFNRQMQLCDMGEQLCLNTRIFHVQRALIYFQRERYDEAEKLFMYALEKKPHDDNILLHLGLTNLKRGEAIIKKDYKLGKSILKRAVNIFDMIAGINPTLFAECFNYSAYAMSICPTEAEISSNGSKFTAPHSENAPHIKKEELEGVV